MTTLLLTIVGVFISLTICRYALAIATKLVHLWYSVITFGLAPERRADQLRLIANRLYEKEQDDRAKGYGPGEIAIGHLMRLLISVPGDIAAGVVQPRPGLLAILARGEITMVVQVAVVGQLALSFFWHPADALPWVVKLLGSVVSFGNCVAFGVKTWSCGRGADAAWRESIRLAARRMQHARQLDLLQAELAKGRLVTADDHARAVALAEAVKADLAAEQALLQQSDELQERFRPLMPPGLRRLIFLNVPYSTRGINSRLPRRLRAFATKALTDSVKRR